MNEPVATIEFHGGRGTRRSLMNCTKDVLASCILELHDVLDREQARREAAEAKLAEAAWGTGTPCLREKLDAAQAAIEQRRTRDADLPAVGSFHG